MSEDILDSPADDGVEAAPLPSEKELAECVRLARLQVQTENEIERLEKQLTAKQAELKAIRETQLPLALTSIGLEGLPLTGGYAITMKEVIAANIPKARTVEAHEWLEKAGHGDLIKHTITITFGKGDHAWAKKFIRDLNQRKKPLAYERKDAVNYQTLGAFVREQFKLARQDGIDPAQRLPFDVLGVFQMKVTDIERPKQK